MRERLAEFQKAYPNVQFGADREGKYDGMIYVAYDHGRLAREMRAEGLPEEFVETVLTGWWTTCLEVLPAKERRRGRW